MTTSYSPLASWGAESLSKFEEPNFSFDWFKPSDNSQSQTLRGASYFDEQAGRAAAARGVGESANSQTLRGASYFDEQAGRAAAARGVGESANVNTASAIGAAGVQLAGTVGSAIVQGVGNRRDRESSERMAAIANEENAASNAMNREMIARQRQFEETNARLEKMRGSFVNRINDFMESIKKSVEAGDQLKKIGEEEKARALAEKRARLQRSDVSQMLRGGY